MSILRNCRSVSFLVTLALCFNRPSWSNTEKHEDVQACSSTDSASGSCESRSMVTNEDRMGPNEDDVEKFLNEEVFGQDINYKSGQFLPMLDDADNDTHENREAKGHNPFFSFINGLTQNQIPALTGTGPSFNATKRTSQDDSVAITKLLEKARALNHEEDVVDGLDILRLGDTLKDVAGQLDRNFGKVLEGVDGMFPFALVYFAAFTDRSLNSSKKRQLHRFYDQVTKDEIVQLHDGLYLSALSYCNSVDDFRSGLATFQRNSWELLYGTTESLPKMPSHFLLIHKELAPLVEPTIKDFFLGKSETEVVVVLVVRGTKDLSDALSDALLEPREYKDGYAHGGILDSGQALVAKHLPRLKKLHEITGRDRIRLIIVGHSLGAGAGAIAAMEFREHKFIKVEAVGFGCPGLLSRELAASTKDYITTVVNDADIVPRMSGASMANLIMDLIEYDWTDDALEDLAFSLDRAREVFDFGKLLPDKEYVLKWVNDFMDKEVRPKFKVEKRERVPSLLIPPGKCIHLFRDGYGFSGTYIPCGYFSSVELSRTIVDDHMIGTGYQRAMLSVVQDMDRNYSFQFSNDLVALGV